MTAKIGISFYVRRFVRKPFTADLLSKIIGLIRNILNIL